MNPKSPDTTGREIAGGIEISSINPISHAARIALESSGLSHNYVDERIDRQRTLIDNQAGRIQNIIDSSRPVDLDTLPGFGSRQMETPDDVEVDSEGNMVGSPEVSADAAVIKMHQDAEEAEKYLRLLGVTNELRSAQGYDATFELATVQRLLQRDYEAVPEELRTPEMRLAEAYIAQEIALLWRPESADIVAGRLGNVPKKNRQLIANPADANIFDESQLENLSDKDRWLIVGSKLADESATVFEQIIEGMERDLNGGEIELTAEEHELVTRLGVHATDMRIRSLQILLQVEGQTEEGREEIKQHIYDLYNKQTSDVQEYYDEIAPPAGYDGPITQQERELMGPAFEFLVVSMERTKRVKDGNFSEFVRLATPREDMVHQSLPNMYKHNGTKVKMSKDIVIQDIGGKFIKNLQLKHKYKRNYDAENVTTNDDGVKVPREVYVGPATAMAFKDDYDVRR